MSVRNIQSNTIGFRKFPAATTRVSNRWIRNTSWPALTAPSDTEQKVIGLYAVWPGDGVGAGGNFFAVTFSGAYTVDFGDGTSVNTASGVPTYKEYDFSNANLYDATVTLTDTGDLVERNNHGYSNGMIVQFYRIQDTIGLTEAQFYYVINATTNSFQVSETVNGSPVAFTNNGSASLLPYKIATVTITPQAGQNLTSVNFNVKHNQASLQTYNTGWLDLAISVPNATTLTISAISPVVFHMYLQRVNVVKTGNITTTSALFASCYELQNVSLTLPNTVTDMTSMFNSCFSLVTVSLFNTSAVTNMTSMFQNCYSLVTVPLFNTSAVTNMTNMFNGCSSLVTVPLFNTGAVTIMTSMFNNCFSLTTVPLFNTGAVTGMSSMFTACRSLTTVPLFNTGAVTNMSSMFNSCSSLVTVPLFNTSAVINMSSMFQNCVSLVTVPLFNTGAVTNMSSMFIGCSSLITVPLFNTSAVTNMSSMFQNCVSLVTVPLFNTSAVTNMASMFSACYSLTSVPLLGVSAVISSSSFSLIFNGCSSLARIQAKDFRFAFSVANCKLSAVALNEIYTNLPTVTGQTITVSGNYGIASDDPTIATAKGWTVTG